MRQTPPLPLRNLACSSSLYSTSPYGGSVTTAWIELGSQSASHSKQSAKMSLDFPAEIDTG
jgi:hypothetical protein